MYYILLALLLATVPEVTHAATTGSLQGLITGIGSFLNLVLIPVILGIAFLSLVWNVVRFFIIGADNEESQQNAKNLALYSVLAFVLMLSFWGIVAMLTNGIGFSNEGAPCDDRQSDYFNKTNLAPCSSLRPQPNPNSGGGTGTNVPAGSPGATGGAGTTVPPGTTSFDIYGNPITTTTLSDIDIKTTISGVAATPQGMALTYAIPKEAPVTAVVSGTIVALTQTSTAGNPTYNVAIKDKHNNFVYMINVEKGTTPITPGTIVHAGDTIGYAPDPIANLGKINVMVSVYKGAAGTDWYQVDKSVTTNKLDAATYFTPTPTSGAQ